MEQHVTAGARVRITFEGTVRHSYQPGDFTLGDGTTVSYLPDRYAAVVLAPGWEVGDIIDTEHGRLTRSVNDGYAHWSRQNDGQMFHDDQVRPEGVTVVHRMTPAPEQAPDPVTDHVARWHAVEALVTRARDKGVTRIDTDLLAEALGLDAAADEKAEPDADADGVSPHNFEAEWMHESDAKRRLPKCSMCKRAATDTAHDGDQSRETRHLRMLLNA